MEQDGIVFIDEIDKIVVNSELRYGVPLCCFWMSAMCPNHSPGVQHPCMELCISCCNRCRCQQRGCAARPAPYH